MRSRAFSARRLAVDLALCNRGEFLVGRLFLVECRFEYTHAIVAPELLSPSDERAVAGDFVMLHRLRGGDDGSIQHSFVRDIAGDFFRFLDDAIDSGAIGAFRLLAALLENLNLAGWE